MRSLRQGAATLASAAVLLVAGPVAPSQAVHDRPTTPSGSMSRAAELDPTVIFSFPAMPIYVEPGQTWQLPVSVNSSVGGRPAMLQRLSGHRWVTVQRTRAKGVRLRFPVKENRAGTFRYRVVVPVHGGFEAKTTKVQVVHVGPITEQTRAEFVPTTIKGTFTGHDIKWDLTVMSWSGSVAFQYIPPVEAGLLAQAHYRPTAFDLTWVVDYTDWRQCHFEGTGKLGLPDAEFAELAGVPDESVTPGGRPDEYSFRLEHQWDDPLLVGTVSCPGEPTKRQEFTTDMGYMVATNTESFDYEPNLRLGYVAGLPETGWVSMVGSQEPSAGAPGDVVRAWNLMGSGRAPFIRPIG